jgi:hypothetical protein
MRANVQQLIEAQAQFYLNGDEQAYNEIQRKLERTEIQEDNAYIRNKRRDEDDLATNIKG